MCSEDSPEIVQVNCTQCNGWYKPAYKYYCQLAVCWGIESCKYNKWFASEQQSMTGDMIKKALQATEEGFLLVVAKEIKMIQQIAPVGSGCPIGVICNGSLYIANLGDPWDVLGRVVKATGEVLSVQLSVEYNASIKSVRKELHAMHPEDTGIVVL